MPGLLDGKTVLLTGATQGVGLQAALGIAQQGPTLVLVGRDAARTQAAVDQVKKVSGNDKVSGMLADLGVQADVRRLVQEFSAQHRQLHVLFNNAGAIFQNRELTPDGYERTFALNHLAPFLLTRLLRELLVASAPARVITTSSGAHRAGKLNFADLMGEQGYGAWRTYCTSKLANILFTRELARRLEGTGVTANCFHPGFIASGFGHNTPGLLSFAVTLGRPFAKSPERGARTGIWLATAPELETVTGKYFYECRDTRTRKTGEDLEAAAKLWDVSEALTGPTLPRARTA